MPSHGRRALARANVVGAADQRNNPSNSSTSGGANIAFSLPSIGGTSTRLSAPSNLPPVVKMSPYMFFHGEPKSAMFSGTSMDTSSFASPTGGRKASVSNMDDDLPATSPFRNGDLGAALFASNQQFTDGRASAVLVDIADRNARLRRTASSSLGAVGLEPQSANLARVHRLVTKCACREASKLVHSNKSSGGNAASSSPLVAVNGSFSSTTMAAAAAGGGATADERLFARAASEIRVAVLVRLLKEEYDISSKTLLETLSDGFQRVNDRLHDGQPVSSVCMSSSSYSAAGSGSIPLAAVFELLELYVNGQASLETRNACFSIFDTGALRVITKQQMRALRGLKESAVRDKTGGAATFPMVKAILDVFQNSSDVSTTLTAEQLGPLFDADDGVLVEGFMEEILRQIAIHEFGANRRLLLPR